MYKNATALIITILNHLKLNTEVLDTGMETTESNNCRVMLRSNRDVNRMLAVM